MTEKSSAPPCQSAAPRDALQSLVREFAEWRLAEYFDRSTAPTDGTYLIKVNQANGNPILMPLNREQNTGLPEGWTKFVANGKQFVGNFVKVALNVAKKDENADRNELPAILRTWFGPDAGAPGTRHFVELSLDGGKWTMSPTGVGVQTPVLWKAYSREQIPSLFGLEFNASVWQQGFVRRGDKTFLLVTLDKSAAADEHKYKDEFLAPNSFQWQSQNRTTQASNDGKSIKEHAATRHYRVSLCPTAIKDERRQGNAICVLRPSRIRRLGWRQANYGAVAPSQRGAGASAPRIEGSKGLGFCETKLRRN